MFGIVRLCALYVCVVLWMYVCQCLLQNKLMASRTWLGAKLGAVRLQEQVLYLIIWIFVDTQWTIKVQIPSKIWVLIIWIASVSTLFLPRVNLPIRLLNSKLDAVNFGGILWLSEEVSRINIIFLEPISSVFYEEVFNLLRC